MTSYWSINLNPPPHPLPLSPRSYVSRGCRCHSKELWHNVSAYFADTLCVCDGWLKTWVTHKALSHFIIITQRPDFWPPCCWTAIGHRTPCDFRAFPGLELVNRLAVTSCQTKLAEKVDWLALQHHTHSRTQVHHHLIRLSCQQHKADVFLLRLFICFQSKRLVHEGLTTEIGPMFDAFLEQASKLSQMFEILEKEREALVFPSLYRSEKSLNSLIVRRINIATAASCKSGRQRGAAGTLVVVG